MPPTRHGGGGRSRIQIVPTRCAHRLPTASRVPLAARLGFFAPCAGCTRAPHKARARAAGGRAQSPGACHAVHALVPLFAHPPDTHALPQLVDARAEMAELQATGARAALPQKRSREVSSAPPETGKYLVIDLFSSCGGVSIAAAELGHTVVLAADFDPVRLKVHAKNHPKASHKLIALGPETEQELMAHINALVSDEDIRKRVWLHLSPPCTTHSTIRAVGLSNGQSGRKVNAKTDKKAGLKLMKWSVQFAIRFKPFQFSIEQARPLRLSRLLWLCLLVMTPIARHLGRAKVFHHARSLMVKF